MSCVKKKTRGSLIIISGTTCAGKGTIIKKLVEKNPDMCLSISYTSRPIRKGEVDGVDYYFVTQEEFERKIENGDFLEYAEVHYGKYYGTPRKETEELLASGKDVILEIDVQGAEQVKKRIKERGAENNEQIISRFKVAYQEINEIPKYNYVVVNDVLGDALLKVESILISEKCRVDRIEEIYVENQEEIIHEFLMDKDFDNSIHTLDEVKKESD